MTTRASLALYISLHFQALLFLFVIPPELSISTTTTPIFFLNSMPSETTKKKVMMSMKLLLILLTMVWLRPSLVFNLP
uniref:Uncharacterized protein n=1 Tax=Arundo donax TaxID=35708 RepID=A0A0A8ZMN4_ARUDO